MEKEERRQMSIPESWAGARGLEGNGVWMQKAEPAQHLWEPEGS